jgi:periplasmic protein CpxP/Spy
MKCVSRGIGFSENSTAKKLAIAAALNLTLVAGLALLPTVAHAQDQDSSDTRQQKLTPEQVVNALATKLNLTDDQKAQITPIVAERQQELRELASDTSMKRRKKRREMKSVFSDSDKKIEALLNDQQKQQYQQIEQQMREQAKERMQQNRDSSN